MDADESPTTGLVNISTESPLFQFEDYTQRVLVASSILIISILGTLGNSLVILAVSSSRKLRTDTNVFVVNLSVADLLTSLVIPWHAVALLSKDHLPVPHVVCGVVAVVIFTAVGSSMYTLASIALNRLLLITRPNTTYLKIYTPKKIAAWLALTWFVPFIAIISPIIGDLGSVGYNGQLHFCGQDRLHRNQHKYDIIIALALYPIPLTTITVCYLFIWKYLRQHERRMAVAPRETEGSSDESRAVASRSLATMDNPPPVRPRQRIRRQNEITKNMFYIVCAFMLCTTPYAICLFITESDALKPYAATIVLMNSCINPLIYATKHRDFKIVFRCILRCKWGNIPESSDCLKTVGQLLCGRAG
ncbi:alpha-1D adrenergic receptor-like [Acanthaster planci]|uniref:Alpha-1D adrenergic receptor-like n=1 Tax=Acanthaster planci TaxID=133434 RepID=A0A8B7XGH8_ACAPL|nr:alpha-1D adrenergic receptor-like [Acanthaster planci]